MQDRFNCISFIVCNMPCSSKANINEHTPMLALIWVQICHRFRLTFFPPMSEKHEVLHFYYLYCSILRLGSKQTTSFQKLSFSRMLLWFYPSVHHYIRRKLNLNLLHVDRDLLLKKIIKLNSLYSMK